MSLEVRPDPKYYDTTISNFTRGKPPVGLVVGTLAKIALLTGLTFSAYRAITFSRRYEQIQRAYKAIYLTPNWDWLAGAAAGGLVEFLLLDWAVRLDISQVYSRMKGDIDSLHEGNKQQRKDFLATRQDEDDKEKVEAKEVASLKEKIASLSAANNEKDNQITSLTERLNKYETKLFGQMDDMFGSFVGTPPTTKDKERELPL